MVGDDQSGASGIVEFAAPDDPAPLVCAIAPVLPIKSVNVIVAINSVLNILSAPMTDRLFLVATQNLDARSVLSNARYQYV